MKVTTFLSDKFGSLFKTLRSRLPITLRNKHDRRAAVFARIRAEDSIYALSSLYQALETIVLAYGLNPKGLSSAWKDWADCAIHTWLSSGDLRVVAIEFYRPESAETLARWDFLIHYGGEYSKKPSVYCSSFQRFIQDSKAPLSDCCYRIVLAHHWNAPLHSSKIMGLGLNIPPHLSSKSLVPEEIGVIIKTHQVMVSAKFFKTPKSAHENSRAGTDTIIGECSDRRLTRLDEAQRQLLVKEDGHDHA